MAIEAIELVHELNELRALAVITHPRGGKSFD